MVNTRSTSKGHAHLELEDNNTIKIHDAPIANTTPVTSNQTTMDLSPSTFYTSKKENFSKFTKKKRSRKTKPSTSINIKREPNHSKLSPIMYQNEKDFMLSPPYDGDDSDDQQPPPQQIKKKHKSSHDEEEDQDFILEVNGDDDDDDLGSVSDDTDFHYCGELERVRKAQKKQPRLHGNSGTENTFNYINVKPDKMNIQHYLLTLPVMTSKLSNDIMEKLNKTVVISTDHLRSVLEY